MNRFKFSHTVFQYRCEGTSVAHDVATLCKCGLSVRSLREPAVRGDTILPIFIEHALTNMHVAHSVADRLRQATLQRNPEVWMSPPTRLWISLVGCGNSPTSISRVIGPGWIETPNPSPGKNATSDFPAWRRMSAANTSIGLSDLYWRPSRARAVPMTACSVSRYGRRMLSSNDCGVLREFRMPPPRSSHDLPLWFVHFGRS